MSDTHLKSLQTLWTTYTPQPVESNTSGVAPKKLATEFVFKEPVQNFRCDLKNCIQCCCRNQGQKIRLLLHDLALLLDHGLGDMIEGTYDSLENVARFLDDPRSEHIYRTPHLKRKKGKDGLDECIFLDEQWRCTIWDKAPFICRTYPVYMEQTMTPDKMVLTFSLDKQCSCTRPECLAEEKPRDYTKRIINDVVSERIEADHTTKLLVYKRDELKRMGFSKYL